MKAEGTKEMDSTRRSTKAPGPFAGELLHGLLLSVAAFVFAWRIADGISLAFVVVGAISGSLAARAVFLAGFRLGPALLAAGFIACAGVYGAEALGDSLGMARAHAPMLVLYVAELVRMWSLAAAAVFALRSAAFRFRPVLAVEGALVVVAIATTVAAHRDGMIARPLEISDWFWTQGIDPVVAFLAIGLLGAVLLAGVLAHGRSVLRTFVQLAVVLVLGIFIAVQLRGLDSDTRKRDAIGRALDKKTDEEARGDEASARGQGGAGGRRDSRPKDDDLPEAGSKGRNRPSAIVIFQREVEPSGGVFYFRHAAFSQFNGVRLVEATRPDLVEERRYDLFGGSWRSVDLDRALEGRTEVATRVALLEEHTRLFGLVDAVEMSSEPNPDPGRFRRTYGVVSRVVTADMSELLGRKASTEEWTADVWQHYTTLPGDARYHELASRIRQGLKVEYQEDPMALALAVKGHLEEISTYSFARKYEGDDPTAEFLFSEDKRGYCVHLAHAAAYLLRAMGVPARVSAGYAVPANNLGGGSALLVKSGDAHAWAELHLANVGWVPLEVTPARSDVEPSAFREQDLQQLLGEMARKEGPKEQAGIESPRLGELLSEIWTAIPWMLLALLVLAYVTKGARLVSPYLGPRRREPVLAYRAALDRLSSLGLLREPGEPRERFARRVAERAPSFVPLTSIHVAVGIGGHDPVRATAGGRLRSLAMQVGAELRQSTPWWRWLLGALNPISWMWSR